MNRKIASAEQIKAEIERRIQQSTAMDGDCRECGAPTPVLLREPDSAGCNWTIMTAPSVTPGCLEVLADIVRGAMAEFNLPS